MKSLRVSGGLTGCIEFQSPVVYGHRTADAKASRNQPKTENDVQLDLSRALYIKLPEQQEGNGGRGNVDDASENYSMISVPLSRLDCWTFAIDSLPLTCMVIRSTDAGTGFDGEQRTP